MTDILKIENLEKSYPEFKLKNVSFSLEKGYIMGLIGPNGAGKTTIIKILMGLKSADSGEIDIFGMNLRENGKSIKERIGFVYDENHFYEELTIKETKNFISSFYKTWDDEKYYQLIKEFNLPEKRKVKDLSKGMKMKMSLALALSHDPDLIIMDEPTSGLDPVFRAEVLDLLRDFIQNENKGILFSSHITTDLDKIADFITFVNDGEVVFSKSKEDIDDEFQLIRGDNDLLESLKGEAAEHFIGIKKGSFGFEGLTNNSEEIRRILGDRVLYQKASLEDIMVYYAKEGKKVAAID